MANRLNAPNQFESLAPPWLLTSLDTNFTQNQAAWNDSSLGFGNGIPVDTGSANAYVVALPFGSPTAYQDGMNVEWIPNNTNTGASTLVVTPLGSAAILTKAGNALQGGELPVNKAVRVTYRSAVPTGFRIISSCCLGLTIPSTGVNQTVECAGYDSVGMDIIVTAALTITMSHLAYGVPVMMHVFNSAASTSNVKILATRPDGTAFSGVFGQYAGGSVLNLTTTGLNLSTGTSTTLSGISTPTSAGNLLMVGQ